MDKTFVLTIWIYAFLYFDKLFFAESNVIPTKQTSLRIRRPCDNCKCWVKKQLSPSEDHSCSRSCNGSYMPGLPPVSIVIIFFNEEPILIHDTLYSILNNTPTELIHEIIFVDDNSDRKDLYGVIPEHKLVRVIHNPSRRGLIQSRMIGARAATAEVLVFLDSHVRTDPYWLEPLLARLVHVKQLTMDCNRSRNSYKNETCETAVGQRLVLSPVIYGLSIPDEIENIPVIGGFSWNFTFRWELMKEERKENQPPSSCGYFDQWKTPAISGGIFATWRQGFFELGGYDEEMDIWGGENIEISLRTWMCHGRLEIVPCSRVGHLYRPVHPYDFPKGKEFTVVRNQKRAALVWLTHKNKLETADVSDNEFDALHYLALFHTASPTASGVPSGSVKLRRRLAQELQCHDFTWYLEHIYPELQNEARLLSISKDNELWSELELEALIESDFS